VIQNRLEAFRNFNGFLRNINLQLQRQIRCLKGATAQGGHVSNKISGVGINFGLLVHILPGPKKQRALKERILLS
jgi:hypothetical protein